MSHAGSDEQFSSTLVLTLVTGQVVTLDAAHTRISNRWFSEPGGLETLEWLLSGGDAQPAQACVVEVDDNGRPMRFFPARAIVVARVDPSPLAE